MIDKNLGNFQRIVRLVTGVLLALWAVSQPSLNGIDWFVITVAVCLIANGIFSRCYAWYLLDIDDRRRHGYSSAK